MSLGGDGPGSRLSAQNFGEWSGDYLAAGVNVIGMDVNNFGTTDLFLRVMFVQFGPMGPMSAAFSTEPVYVPGGSGWQNVTFNVSPSALTAIPMLPGSVLDALSSADEFRLFHNPDPFFAPGFNPPIVANLGVDNITASLVPEPATGVLLVGGLLAVRLANRLRGRRTLRG